MCSTTKELEMHVAKLRSLKALREETDAEIRETENEIIEFLHKKKECETIDKNGKAIRQYIGTDYKITYSIQTREGINKEAVKNLLNKIQFESVRTESTFGVLRIK